MFMQDIVIIGWIKHFVVYHLKLEIKIRIKITVSDSQNGPFYNSLNNNFIVIFERGNPL